VGCRTKAARGVQIWDWKKKRGEMKEQKIQAKSLGESSDGPEVDEGRRLGIRKKQYYWLPAPRGDPAARGSGKICL